MTSNTGKILLVIVGVAIFAQFVMGDAVARLLSYADSSKEPTSAGPRGSALKPTSRDYKHAVTILPSAIRGDQQVYDILAPACGAAGGGFEVFSWYRKDALVRGDPNNPSCHAQGKGTEAGAWDIRPKAVRGRRDWSRLDVLDTELRQTAGVGEIVWRGDDMHDPKAGAGRIPGTTPHLHAAVNCG